jgi:hypothetical protein
VKKTKWYTLVLACIFWATYGMAQNVAINEDSMPNANAILDIKSSNKVRIGNAGVTRIEGQVPFSTPSDGRFKNQVREDVKGLDFILHLRPVTFQLDAKRFDEQLRGKNNIHDSYGLPDAEAYRIQAESGYKEASAIRRSGFIAQEVEKAANSSGYNFSGLSKPQNEQDYYSLSYEAFVVPLVKAIQEQQKIIADLQKQINELKQQQAK